MCSKVSFGGLKAQLIGSASWKIQLSVSDEWRPLGSFADLELSVDVGTEALFQ